MKHKVANLEGALLDEAVALVIGAKPRKHLAGVNFDSGATRFVERFEPYSSNWASGGPIIQRERITVSAHGSGAAWHADHFDTTRRAYGPTPLIAGMRAFVASRFGDEVELP